MRVAAIDVGSTATRLLICRVEEASGAVLSASFPKVELELRFPVLAGEGVAHAGRISEPRARELAECFRKIRMLLAVRRVDSHRAVATAAFRTAANAPEVVELVQQASGIRIEVISAAEEARLSILPLIREGFGEPGGVLLVDVGGLSTDLCLSLPTASEPTTWSFAVGTLRQSADEGFQEAQQQLGQAVGSIFARHHDIGFAAVGGSIHHIARLWGNGSGELTLRACCRCIAEAAPLGSGERVRRWQLSALRAETIVRAARIYQLLLESASRPSVSAPLAGVRYGLILSLLPA